LQIADLERQRKVKQLERERQTVQRMEELRSMESEQQVERTRQLSRSLQYRSTLDLQSQLQAQLAGSKGDSPFSPLVRSTMLLPRNKHHLAVDLAPLPEFQQTRYTARHPKRIPTNPLGSSPSPPKAVLSETLKPDIARFFGVEDSDAVKRPMQRNLSDYGAMVMRQGDRSPFAEPTARGVQGYSDTRHLIN